MSMKHPLTDSQRATVIKLLRTTDLTMTAIAARVGCSHERVGYINRAHKIRPRVSGGSVGAYMKLNPVS